MPIPEPFLQYGLLGIVLFFVGFGIWKFITPIRDAQVDLVQAATRSLQGMNAKMESMIKIDSEIWENTLMSNELHGNPDSLFSTVHTNDALVVFSKMANKVSTAMEVDISDEATEIREILGRQDH